jgi:hypothetical protein
LNNNYKILTYNMFSVTSCCYEKTLPCDNINNSPLGGNLQIRKHHEKTVLVLAPIKKDKEYESTDGYVPNPEPWDRAKETRCNYIARVGMRFS